MLRKELLEAGRERQRIDWARIGDAVEFYQNRGYTYMEVPWTVPPEASKVTFAREALTSQAGDLLGSAEQAFIDMLLRGDKLPQFVVAVSPCFRIEPEYNQFHHLSFMKVELFSPQVMMFEKIQRDAWEFFKRYGLVLNKEAQELTLPIDKAHVDFVCDGVELGSYGVRLMSRPSEDPIGWAYGTGLAEPRTSVALEKRNDHR
jgi:hypothetical protein